MKNLLEAAKAAKYQISRLTTRQKNDALEAMAQALLDQTDSILEANAADLEAAKAAVSDVMLDRLRLTAQRIEAMAKGIREIVPLVKAAGFEYVTTYEKRRPVLHKL